MIVMNGILVLCLFSGGMSDLREPCPSPDGETVVFCFRGDIWEAPLTGGTMRCLVPGESIETSPSYSPDGERLAFTSDRSGGGDVYVMDATGSLSTRLTFHAEEDLVLCWNSSADSIYFLSSREGGENWVYSVSVSGGTPRPVARVETQNICLLPEDIAIERGFTPWWRKHYSGSASRNIWIGSGETWELLADSELDEKWPMYSAVTGEILFVMEDSSGHNAVWSILPGEEPLQRTFFSEGHITFPAISSTGGIVVFEYEGRLFSMNIPGWSVSEIMIESNTDYPFPMQYGETVGYSTDCFDVDSSGIQMAVVGTGDLFAGRIFDNSLEDMVEIYSGSSRARDPAWSPDGMILAFTFENEGIIELALAYPELQDTVLLDSAFPDIQILSTSANVATRPVWSPEGGRISYLDGPGRLHVIDIRNEQDITLCGISEIIHHAWSPDGMWLAFSVPVLAHREEIFIVSSRGGEPFNISRHPNDDFQPFWTTDGRRILYASRTDNGNYSIKQVWLTREDWDCDCEEREALLDDHRITVEIEWDGLQRRTETLCTVKGYYDFYGASPDGRIIAFPAWDSSDRMDLWTVDWKGESLTRLTWSGESPEGIQVTNDQEIYYIAIGGLVRSTSVDGGAGGVFGWRMPVWRSIPLVQAQKFDEAWRLLRDNFYDPDMHQVDWDAMRIKYRERAVSSIISEDFNDVVRRMLGELSASHLGISGSWYFDSSPRSGSVGIIPDHNWTGNGIRVDSVIPYSPADLDGSLLLPGDIITSIHGIPVGADDNLYRALLQRSGRETGFHVLRNNAPLDIDIEPVSVWRIRDLLYDEWIERNRREVARLTDGRVGYLHIPSMSNRSVDDFLVDLFAEGMNRDGMIIDIRYNGGGSTHDEIIRELGRPPYMFSRDRRGNIAFEPLGIWQKPLVLLINERCYSDAEIFPGGWKELGLGPVVGEETYGAVIGTSDVYLVDGTSFRIPATGWYTLTGENLENTGVEPDVRVQEQPADAGLNIDRQLEAAAEIILDLI